MNKKLIGCLAFTLMASIGCTPMRTVHTQDIKTLSSTAKTADDHEALASHYEAEAKLFEEKVEAHKKLLEHFEREPWLFGRQGVDFENHCNKLIQIYSQAAEANFEMAKMHRELAEGAKP
ncbi:hypothetical protein [Candidatus Methylomicrobium oryzae]|uniref:hypothetical protein n=1 Tax=Candidatus Methylomicrobium oryzae TaxID=2802053 RepID=UPI001F406C39|nr:hypothetical protein [Methylomicrobium sp. RS1]